MRRRHYQLPTDLECAHYCVQAYERDGGTLLPGWALGDIFFPGDAAWGLGMVSYYHARRHALVIAFKGTDSLMDLFSDISIFRERPTPHAEQAEDRVRAVIAAADQQMQAGGGTPADGPGSGGAAAGANRGLAVLMADLVLGSENFVRVLLLQIVAKVVSTLISAGLAGGLANLPVITELLEAISTQYQNLRVLTERLLAILRPISRTRETELDLAEELTHALERLEQEEVRSVTFVGHSLGAYLAELCSCRVKTECDERNLQVRAVTLDSPGCRETVEAFAAYRLPDYNHVHSYLSAPNIVNTCNHHIGGIRRVYIKHAQGGFWGGLAHFISCSHGSTARVAAYGGAILAVATTAVGVGAVGTTGVVAGTVQATAGAVGASSGIGAAATIVTGAVVMQYFTKMASIVYQGIPWLLRQHLLDNIRACFGNAAEPPTYSIMESWPCMASIFLMTHGAWTQLLKSFRPFPDDEPGVRNLLKENRMRELRCQRLPGYQLTRHVGIFADWARPENDPQPEAAAGR